MNVPCEDEIPLAAVRFGPYNSEVITAMIGEELRRFPIFHAKGRCSKEEGGWWLWVRGPVPETNEKMMRVCARTFVNGWLACQRNLSR